MNGSEHVALVHSIQTEGLLKPILLYQGKILDGRHRHAACADANVEPRYEEFLGNDEEAMARVLADNVLRRHLKIVQRAAIAVQLLPHAKAQALNRMLRGSHPPHNCAEGPETAGEATAQVGQIVSLSRETVRRAAKACKVAEVLDLMRRGRFRSVNEAERFAALPSDDRDLVLQRLRRTPTTVSLAEVMQDLGITPSEKPATQGANPVPPAAGSSSEAPSSSPPVQSSSVATQMRQVTSGTDAETSDVSGEAAHVVLHAEDEKSHGGPVGDLAANGKVPAKDKAQPPRIATPLSVTALLCKLETFGAHLYEHATTRSHVPQVSDELVDMVYRYVAGLAEKDPPKAQAVVGKLHEACAAAVLPRHNDGDRSQPVPTT